MKDVEIPCECHGRISGRHLSVFQSHLEDPESSTDDDGGGKKDVPHQTSRQDLLLQMTRRFLQDVVVDRLKSQALCRRPVHDDVDPQNLK